MAHIRTGDKGNLINICVMANGQNNYNYLKDKLTEDVVGDFYQEFFTGQTVRYDVDNLLALNFVLHNFNDGGVTRNLRLDRHGKSMGMALLELDI